MKPIVVYICVSTSQQGCSGLGIEAQRDALIQFAAGEGLEIVAEFVEVETGKGNDALYRRPQLAAALSKARASRCAVAVAKLDQLSRQAIEDTKPPLKGRARLIAPRHRPILVIAKSFFATSKSRATCISSPD